MAIHDIFQIDLIGNIGGALAVNVFHYQCQTSTIFAIDVALEFNAELLPKIAAVEGVRKLYDLIKVKNLFNSQDDYELDPTPVGGTQPGEDMGNFASVPFSLGHGDRSVRSGAKRFGPIMETAQAGGVIDNAPYIANMDDLADHLEERWSIGEADDVVPVIVQRIPYIPEGSEDTAYRLPADQEESVSPWIQTATPLYRLTSQNSRKPWVGQ